MQFFSIKFDIFFDVFEQLRINHIIPRIFDDGHVSFVDAFDDTFDEKKKIRSRKIFSVETFRSHFHKNFVPQNFALLQKLRPQFFLLQNLQALQIAFVFDRTHNGKTVAFNEVIFYQFPHVIFLLVRPLLHQSVFQILLRRNHVSLVVLQLQSEVPENPEQAREILGDFVDFELFFVFAEPQIFRQIHNQAQIVKRLFVDGPERIIN